MSLPDIIFYIFIVYLVVLYYISIKKCFYRGDKSKIKLFLLSFIGNPVISYIGAMLTAMLPLRLLFMMPFFAALFDDADEKAMFGLLIPLMLLIGLIYTTYVFLFSRLLAKWLKIPNKPFVTFVALMYGVLFAMSLSSGVELSEFTPDKGLGVDIFGTAVVFIAGPLMYHFVIRQLAKLTDKPREIEMRPFIVPPAVFCLLYSAFAFSLEMFMEEFQDLDDSTRRMLYLLIYSFSAVILFLFIWAFTVIIKNINATHEALDAKELAAELARAEAKREADLSIAKEIQSSALPTVFPPFPERKDFELYATMHTAKEVGGDFYDFYMLGDSTLGFLIADVSGKSIPGAMFMMTSKTVIKSLAESGQTPAEVFTIANEKLCEGNEAEMFVTAWLGYLDLKTGLVRIANAGHNPPVLIRDGNASYIKLKAGLVLAGMDGFPYKEQTFQLQKGDILYLYTDGVTEAMDKDDDQYGEDRLKKILSFGEHYPESDAENGITETICETVGEDIAVFTAGAEQSDDITMLCIKYLGE